MRSLCLLKICVLSNGLSDGIRNVYKEKIYTDVSICVTMHAHLHICYTTSIGFREHHMEKKQGFGM